MKPPFPEGTVSDFYPTSQHYFLSNFYSSCMITYEGITYTSTEHAFQAAKSLDHDVRMSIMRTQHPAAAKKMGRAIAMRPDWNQVKLQVMKELLEIKFGIPDLRQRLLATGDNILIEGNWWHDQYWGQCSCPKHKWEGENHLGLLLMEVRDACKQATPGLGVSL